MPESDLSLSGDPVVDRATLTPASPQVREEVDGISREGLAPAGGYVMNFRDILVFLDGGSVPAKVAFGWRPGWLGIRAHLSVLCFCRMATQPARDLAWLRPGSDWARGPRRPARASPHRFRNSQTSPSSGFAIPCAPTRSSAIGFVWIAPTQASDQPRQGADLGVIGQVVPVLGRHRRGNQTRSWFAVPGMRWSPILAARPGSAPCSGFLDSSREAVRALNDALPLILGQTR